ncbi:FAD-binding oxidoreductase [Geodermatophilus sp. YIM 151500]|uniref:FAD-binding oxidoreductase n=1 Tax=Geodermatophilus sp. YIM 151500 TaxID=2984531 RepID=UPI0021E36CA7|nr:FAD-binding oxidoreductase [Geodermatophilus sp. YIM 151500]MCV2491928.1 FAD-binding oxidoreductase [Geodermatophilus sp. YIM 151500]
MTITLERPAFDSLRADMRGEVIGPADPGYETARRVHNGMIDKRPAVIARCTGVADVQAALHFGIAHDLPVAVRGGGHNVAGKAVCDDGIVIDLSPMKGMRVLPGERVAQAQAGLTWGEFDRETQAFGLATTGGAISTTGIAGLTLGGGIGWLQRKHGLTCDNLLSADVVLADGRFLRANGAENEDLFWGLRGGGGNFGIVTSFEYRLHPVGRVVGGPVVYPFDAAREVFRFYRDYSAAAPDDLFVEFGMATLPDGQRAVMVFVVYAGPLAAADDVLRPLREFGSPLEDMTATMSYCEVQQAFDADFPDGILNYWKSSNIRELTDDAIETMVAFMAASPSLRPMVIIDQFGGAVARVPDDATAFGHRDAAYDLIIAAIWSAPGEQEAHIDWARRFWEAMQPHASGDVYVNYLSEEGQDRVRDAYGHHYARLVDLKRRYDPHNVFRGNQNIQP